LKPPAAITGILTASAQAEISSELGIVPVWPPPSPPCTTTASAPNCSAFCTWRGAPQVGMQSTPASFSLRISVGSGERL
jgi:hypothetical protein